MWSGWARYFELSDRAEWAGRLAAGPLFRHALLYPSIKWVVWLQRVMAVSGLRRNLRALVSLSAAADDLGIATACRPQGGFRIGDFGRSADWPLDAAMSFALKGLRDVMYLASQQVFVHIERGVARDLWPSISERSALSGQWPSSHEFRPHVDVRTHMEVNESPHAGGRTTVACVGR